MSRRVKRLMVQELAERFQNVPDTGCVLIDYKGISAGEAEQARTKVAEAEASLNVVKNAVFNQALKEVGIPELSDLVNGPTAVIVGNNPVESAKLADELMELAESVKIRGGFFSGRVAGADEVERLAGLPGRQELLGQVAMAMNAPLQGFASGMTSLLRKFAVAVNELKEQREEESGE